MAMGEAKGGAAGRSPLVLIVEDERDIADMLADYFGIEGYRTLVAGDAASAVEACRRGPDVILLDVNLPDGDGFEVCAKVRDAVACPIVFLTARVEDADAVAGFAAGGDDYVTKPFSLEVLGARVRAHLARRDGRPVELARKDFDIVALLAKRPGQVFDRDMIRELAWDEPGDSSVVTEHIRRIRRAFAQAGCEADPIETSWGVGYSWRA